MSLDFLLPLFLLLEDFFLEPVFFDFELDFLPLFVFLDFLEVSDFFSDFFSDEPYGLVHDQL